MQTRSILAISHSQFNNLLILPYIILLMVGMMIPSDGSHGIFSIKSLAFVGSVFTLCAYLFFCKTFQCNQIYLFLFLISYFLFLNVWIFYSIHFQTDYLSLYDQFKLFFLTISVVGMTIFIAQEKLLSYTSFLKILIYSNFFYSVVKIAVVILFLTGIINLEFFLEKIGIRFMSMAIFGNLTRLQTSVDIVTPFLLFFLLQSNQLKVNFTTRFKFFYLVFSILSILLSFSRFLMVIGLIACFFSWCSTNLWSKFKWLTVFIGICAIGVYFVGYNNISSIIELRFSSSSAYESDSTRNQQIAALSQEFHQYPLLGKGIGSYSENMIRDESIKHSYEVQWMAFLMQFGLIGIFFLIVPLLLISIEFLIPPFSFIKITSLCMFLLWLASGLFNPFLISLSSGILYSLFAWTGRRLRLNSF